MTSTYIGESIETPATKPDKGRFVTTPILKGNILEVTTSWFNRDNSDTKVIGVERIDISKIAACHITEHRTADWLSHRSIPVE